jgi:hypothetical protein
VIGEGDSFLEEDDWSCAEFDRDVWNRSSESHPLLFFHAGPGTAGLMRGVRTRSRSMPRRSLDSFEIGTWRQLRP